MTHIEGDSLVGAKIDPSHHIPRSNMHVLNARNVNDAYRQGLQLIDLYGESLPSRNGPVLRVPGLVVTEYKRPMERVLFDAQRNANPFFHLFEALWMLDGRNDVKTLDQFLPSFKQFSDDGVTYHGAYGERWRHWPRRTHGVEFDQLHEIIRRLRFDKTDRRAVIGMWDPARDLMENSKDIPCNDVIKVSMVEGALDMQVFCRSNDIVFGAYGANAVHFAFLLEYLAACIGVPPGKYFQISGDFHAYVETPYKLEKYYPLQDDDYRDPYETMPSIMCEPLIDNAEAFDEELSLVMRLVEDHTFHEIDVDALDNRFFIDVAQPMYAAHRLFREGKLNMARRLLDDAMNAHELDIDWLRAGAMWIKRLVDRREKI